MPSLDDLIEQTPQELLALALERLTLGFDTREGSFTYDVLAASAYAHWYILQQLASLPDKFYVTEDSGDYLDRMAGVFGLERKQGACATAAVTFSGSAGIVIPAGTTFLTESGLQFALDADITLNADGSGSGTLTAAEVGADGNVPAGTISQCMATISGLTSFAAQAASGGADAETSQSLCDRLYRFLRTPATSGNAVQYCQWAESVDGVGLAACIERWNGAGTVKVVLCGDDMGAAQDAIVDAAAAYIETVRPVCVDVTVTAATVVEVTISATVTLSASVSLETVTQTLSASVKEYLAGLALSGNPVIYNHIVLLLLSIDGVEDFSGLTVNGGTENLALAEDETPVLKAVTLT